MSNCFDWVRWRLTRFDFRTTRTFEAIYAGCIPAFIVDRNTFPFQDILDYSLFSVTIPENEAHRIEEILEAYSDEALSSMQAHLLKVREAFLFKEGFEWARKGPLFFSLISMAMRLPLEYPQVGSCLSNSFSSSWLEDSSGVEKEQSENLEAFGI